MISVLLLSALLQHPSASEPPTAVPQPLSAKQEFALPAREDLRYDGEFYFGTMRRLSTDGENAEGYFSWGGTRITYQSTFGDRDCDQIYELDLLSGARRMVSTGTGRTTCSYFMAGDDKIIFASTHGFAKDCLPPADRSSGYVWKIYPQFDLYVRDLDSWELTPLVPHDGYDAEAVVSPDGEHIVFTSRRSGDLEIFIMDADGSNLTQLTDELGYDGGPFFSADSQKIVYRSYYPETEAEAKHYRDLLARDSIEPMNLQIRTMNVDGSNKFQVTHNEAANFGPYWHPDGKRIIYCSNQESETGRDFDLFMVNADGSDDHRVTFCPSFDGFPMFSHDGRNLIFSSNRNASKRGDTNMFMAEWLDDARPAK